MDNHTVQLLLYAQQKYFCLVELKAKAYGQTIHYEMLLSDPLTGLYFNNSLCDDKIRHVNSQDLSSLCDLELSLDDSSTASSEISLDVSEDDVWRSYNPNNYLRNSHGVYREHSWMIHFYERNRHAGDSIWFRVWRNEDSSEFLELEDTEILQWVESEIQSNPYGCFFYVNMTRRGGLTTTSLFDTNLILRALRAILDQAQHRDRIVLPSKSFLDQAILLENKEKRGLLTWLCSGVTGRYPPEVGEIQNKNNAPHSF